VVVGPPTGDTLESIMARLPSWLDPEAPSSTSAGVVGAVAAVAACTLVIYPLKRVVNPLSLDAVYIPAVLFVATKWGGRIGLFSALLGGLAFDFFHVPPTGRFTSLASEAVLFVAVAGAAVFVAGLTQRARSADERRRAEVAARARVLAAADEARRRLVRDLHDGAQERLVHTVITLKLANRALDGGDADAGLLLGEALQHAEQANLELRELAHGILPSVLTRGGLRAGVEALVTRISLPVTVDLPVERLPAGIEATAYFVISEALTNAVKHARADRAAVAARVEDGVLRIEISDDGIGGVRGGDGNAGMSGLGGLEDRVSALDGRLVVDSPAGRGTRVCALLPLHDAG
jgi:signal transduction histidine kinase